MLERVIVGGPQEGGEYRQEDQLGCCYSDPLRDQGPGVRW